MRCNLLPVIFFLCLFTAAGCKRHESDRAYPNSALYNFNSPKVITLPKDLDEISGLSYYAKDSSVFAITDEDGLLYKIPLKHPEAMREWRYDNKRDFEDVVLRDSVFYVLISNGSIDKLQFAGDHINIDKIDFPAADKSVNEFETLYEDPTTHRLIMECKDCEADGKNRVSSFALNDSSRQFDFFAALNPALASAQLSNTNKKLKPSAAAVNPITQELYILCSVNHLLLVTDLKQQVKQVFELNPEIYKQPEGIAFTPEGHLIISNEAHGGEPNLLLLKNKMHK